MSPSNPPKAITSSDLAAQISNFALDKKAENVINIRLKANIAQDLFDYKRFYEKNGFNEKNIQMEK